MNGDSAAFSLLTGIHLNPGDCSQRGSLHLLKESRCISGILRIILSEFYAPLLN